MKHAITLIVFFTLSFSYAQNTSILDSNFEQALIDIGLDTGPLDGIVPTANIDTLNILSLFNKNISDLTGIEGFTSLEYLTCSSNNLTSLDVSYNENLINLDCQFNLLTSLDVSYNTNLVSLECQFNQIDSLDVSQNINLEKLWCYDNQLLSIDVSQNVLLERLSCNDNLITNLDVSMLSVLKYLNCNANLLSSLDISHNTDLIHLYCNDNQLSCLNIKNGNNVNFTFFKAINNPSLSCIEVDDSIWASTNWASSSQLPNIDNSASFSSDCNNACSSAPLLSSSDLSALEFLEYSDKYKVTINGTDIRVYRSLYNGHKTDSAQGNHTGSPHYTNDITKMSFAGFDMPSSSNNDTLTIEITLLGSYDFSSYDIRPWCNSISANVTSTVMTFDIHEPQKLLITNNDSLEDVLVLTANPYHEPPNPSPNILYFNSDTIYLDSGRYILNDNDTIYIAENSIVLGALMQV